jgi:p-hydroxybenzoate 3-monooxygenase
MVRPVTKDLMTAREAEQLKSFYEAQNVQVKDFYTAPKVEFEYQGKDFQIQCDFIAGDITTVSAVPAT